MPGEWGLHTVKELLRIDPDTRIVMLTAYGSIATALEAVRLGARSYLQKPATVDEIELSFRDGEAPEPLTESPAEVPSLARAEWEHINRVLTECDGNIRKAARLLGLHRRTLQRKLAKFPVAR
jgi:two-component system response regulator RegA